MVLPGLFLYIFFLLSRSPSLSFVPSIFGTLLVISTISASEIYPLSRRQWSEEDKEQGLLAWRHLFWNLVSSFASYRPRIPSNDLMHGHCEKELNNVHNGQWWVCPLPRSLSLSCNKRIGVHISTVNCAFLHVIWFFFFYYSKSLLLSLLFPGSNIDSWANSH